MNTTFTLVAAALLSLGLGGCASTGPAHERRPLCSPTTQLVSLPRRAGSGDGKEVSILLDEPCIRLATIALRGGTQLPPHTAPVPVTIQVIEGAGVIHAGGEALSVTQGSLVLLEADQEHDVIPNEHSDMLLLVHYLLGAS